MNKSDIVKKNHSEWRKAIRDSPKIITEFKKIEKENTNPKLINDLEKKLNSFNFPPQGWEDNTRGEKGVKSW